MLLSNAHPGPDVLFAPELNTDARELARTDSGTHDILQFIDLLLVARTMPGLHLLVSLVVDKSGLHRGCDVQAVGSGIWPMMVLVSEIVQTVILADFCYYYVKSIASGIELVQLPAGIV